MMTSEIKSMSYLIPTTQKKCLEFSSITHIDINDNLNMEQVIKNARETGADGIMLVGKAGSSGIGVPLGNLTYVLSEEYGITSIAIKYK